jgi:hypothetical protein
MEKSQSLSIDKTEMLSDIVIKCESVISHKDYLLDIWEAPYDLKYGLGDF